MTLKRGLYDLLLTEAVEHALSADSSDAFDVHAHSAEGDAEQLVDAVARQLRRLLSEVHDTGEHGALRQLEIVNGILAWMRDSRTTTGDVELVTPPPRVLRAVRRSAEPPPEYPDTGLAAPWLFTAGRGSPSLLNELRREAAACDEIDILVSFITVSGVRKLIDILRSATAADASGTGRAHIRVLTTTYTGATEIAALDELARLNGCEVRVSLDGRRTRLHAKAWIFQRATGFGSAYVGSANLSGAALMGGLEWTVKFTERGQAALFERAKAHFETLWLDGEFTHYDPSDENCRAALAAALSREGDVGYSVPLGFFDIQPKTYQREMLEELARERRQGRTRNLLVAATGTGKTVVAALDYREMCETLGHRPRLLFVAHRAQILRQALRTYREVLRDHSFGDVLTGGVTPAQQDYLFASIDSLTSRDLVARLGSSYWHTVVIDECHRIAADRFDRFATAIDPAQLLGLTATPERSDGQPIERYFTPRPDGSPAVELRLWDALEMQLLSPFEYYGCDDDTDFSDVPWERPGESTALHQLVAENELRARTVINEWKRLSARPRASKALAFCVSVAHARFMAAQFNRAGLPALCVTGDTPRLEQLRAPRMLSEGKICVLVTVDLYNEGVDVPDVDTLLLLRPTQSALLFQQQLGRGLRLSPGKESCLVLDFVGQHRAEFRFDRLLGGITGLTRNELIGAVEHGFAGLPPGCHIHLEPQARRQVLANLRAAVHQSWRRLGGEVQSYAATRGDRAITLGGFLHDQRIALREVYRSATPSGWTTLKRTAGVLRDNAPSEEANLSRRLGDLIHLDDPAQLRFIQRVSESPVETTLRDSLDQRRAQMLTYQVDSGRHAVSYTRLLRKLRETPTVAQELGELAAILLGQSRLEDRVIPGLESVPLRLHGAYRIREILTAVGFLTDTRRTPFQAGVLALRDSRTELLFVTLDKSEGYHDRIAYNDYAASAGRFHWQTQNSAGPNTAAGRRYIGSRDNGWRFQLFVRSTKDHPYRACGPVRIESADDITGDRPMSITWSLDVPLPPNLFAEFSVIRAQ